MDVRKEGGNERKEGQACADRVEDEDDNKRFEHDGEQFGLTRERKDFLVDFVSQSRVRAFAAICEECRNVEYTGRSNVQSQLLNRSDHSYSPDRTIAPDAKSQLGRDGRRRKLVPRRRYHAQQIHRLNNRQRKRHE